MQKLTDEKTSANVKQTDLLPVGETKLSLRNDGGYIWIV
jgi:hypothetical protein